LKPENIDKLGSQSSDGEQFQNTGLIKHTCIFPHTVT